MKIRWLNVFLAGISCCALGCGAAPAATPHAPEVTSQTPAPAAPTASETTALMAQEPVLIQQTNAWGGERSSTPIR